MKRFIVDVDLDLFVEDTIWHGNVSNEDDLKWKKTSKHLKWVILASSGCILPKFETLIPNLKNTSNEEDLKMRITSKYLWANKTCQKLQMKMTRIERQFWNIKTEIFQHLLIGAYQKAMFIFLTNLCHIYRTILKVHRGKMKEIPAEIRIVALLCPSCLKLKWALLTPCSSSLTFYF